MKFGHDRKNSQVLSYLGKGCLSDLPAVRWALHFFLGLLTLRDPKEHTESKSPLHPLVPRHFIYLQIHWITVSSQQRTNLPNPIVTKKKRETKKMMLYWVIKLKAPGSPKVCLAILWIFHHNVLNSAAPKALQQHLSKRKGKDMEKCEFICFCYCNLFQVQHIWCFRCSWHKRLQKNMQFCSLEFSLLEELMHARSSGFIWQYIQCCQGQSMIFLRLSQFSNKLGRNVEWEFSRSGPSGCFGIILMPAVLPGCCFFSPTSQNYSKLSLGSFFTCSFLPQEQGFLMLGTCWGHAVLIFYGKCC